MRSGAFVRAAKRLSRAALRWRNARNYPHHVEKLGASRHGIGPASTDATLGELPCGRERDFVVVRALGIG
jgi:hypothetical protein